MNRGAKDTERANRALLHSLTAVATALTFAACAKTEGTQASADSAGGTSSSAAALLSRSTGRGTARPDHKADTTWCLSRLEAARRWTPRNTRSLPMASRGRTSNQMQPRIGRWESRWGPDGALYITDDKGGRVWRVVYKGSAK